MAANANNFIRNNFANLTNFKIKSSKMYSSPGNPDNWWFQIYMSNLVAHDFIVLSGALDPMNQDFRIYLVPTRYFINNIASFYSVNGFIFLYLSHQGSFDLRGNSGISFDAFRLN